MIIAIDGPAASGKGTLARRLADELGLAKLDTGLLYRAVGFAVVSGGGDPENTEQATKAAK
ncbi:MAG: (d)CMP kinase, partial [Rhodospirillaceae bacterium]|nr:(d)CMP kinase [Rhodospirillaceae bacterium]